MLLTILPDSTLDTMREMRLVATLGRRRRWSLLAQRSSCICHRCWWRHWRLLHQHLCVTICHGCTHSHSHSGSHCWPRTTTIALGMHILVERVLVVRILVVLLHPVTHIGRLPIVVRRVGTRVEIVRGQQIIVVEVPKAEHLMRRRCRLQFALLCHLPLLAHHTLQILEEITWRIR